MNLLRNDDFPSEMAFGPGFGLVNKIDRAHTTRLDQLVLIVTSAPDRFVSVVAKTVLVRTCKDALQALKKSRFSAVFCDFGPLGPDENGLRFAYTLQRTGVAPPLFLMADEITLADESQAMHQGARSLILKKAEAVVAVLAPVSKGGQRTPVTSVINKPPIAEQDLDRVRISLRRYIGPIADDMVFKTLASIAKCHPDGVPLSALVHAVSNYIEVAKERDRFLTDLDM